MSRRVFLDWFYESYETSLQLSGPNTPEGGKRYLNFLSSLDVGLMSGVVRMNSFDVLKYEYPLKQGGYYCVVFSILLHPDRTHYAYLYWPRSDPDIKTPEYVCVSSTYNSRDGEYRRRFVLYSTFETGYKDLAKEFSPVEEFILNQIQKGDITLESEIFPRFSERNEEILAFINSERLNLRLIVIAWVLDAGKAEMGILQLHIHPAYGRIMKKLYQGKNKLQKKFASKDLIGRLTIFITGAANSATRVACGQKVTPLSVREVTQYNYIGFAAWREVYIGRLCTDLVINFIAPMYPIYNQWMYIEGANSNFFENDVMKERYRLNSKARQTVETLQTARKQTYVHNRPEIGPEGYHFGRLESHIFDSIEYAQSFLVMSDYALCSTTEYVGKTIRSVPSIIRRAAWIGDKYEKTFSHIDIFAKYMFDYLYGAHVMHTKLGIAHTDLHLNNLTLYKPVGEYRPKNPLIAYIGSSGESETYIFPHSGLFGYLIDFSRSIIGPGAKTRLEADFDNRTVSRFYRDQTTRVLRTLHRYAPHYTEKHKEILKGLILTNFQAVFRVLSAIDFLAVGRNILSMLKKEKAYNLVSGDKRSCEISEKVIQFAHRAEILGKELFLNNLHQVVTGEIKTLPPYAGDVILPKLFKRYLFSEWDPKKLREGTLVDVYNYRNKLRYSSSDYDKFPPWAQFEELQKHLGKLDIDDVLNRGPKPFLEALKIDPYVDIILEKTRLEEEPPLAEASSWMAD